MIGEPPEVIILSDDDIDCEDDVCTKVFVGDASNHKTVPNTQLKDLRFSKSEICRDFVASLPDMKTITKRERPHLKKQTSNLKRIKLTLLKNKPINELSDVSSKESLSDLDVLSDITSDDDSLSTISDAPIIEVNDSDDEILLEKQSAPSTSTNCNKMNLSIGDNEKTNLKRTKSDEFKSSEQSSVDINKTNSKRNKIDENSSLPSPVKITELYLPFLDKNKIETKCTKSDQTISKVPLSPSKGTKNDLLNLEKNKLNPKCNKNDQSKSSVALSPTNLSNVDQNNTNSKCNKSDHSKSSASSSLQLSPKNCTDKNDKINSKQNKIDQNSSLPLPEKNTELYLPFLDKNKTNSKCTKSDQTISNVPLSPSKGTKNDLLNIEKNKLNPKCNKNDQSKSSVALSPTNLSNVDQNNTNSKCNKSDHSKSSASSSLQLSPKNCTDKNDKINSKLNKIDQNSSLPLPEKNTELYLPFLDKNKTNSKCTKSDQTISNVPLSPSKGTKNDLLNLEKNKLNSKCNKNDQSKKPKNLTESDITIVDKSSNKLNSKCTKSDHSKSSVSSSLPSSPTNLSLVDQNKANSKDNKNHHSNSNASSSLQLSPKNCAEKNLLIVDKNKTNSKCTKTDQSKLSVSPSLPLSPTNSIENDWQIVNKIETYSKGSTNNNHSKLSPQSSLPLSPKNRKDDVKKTRSKCSKHDQSKDTPKIDNKSKSLLKHKKETRRKHFTKKVAKKNIENNNDEGKKNQNNNVEMITNAQTEISNELLVDQDQLILILKKELCQTEDEIEMLRKNRCNLNSKIDFLEDGLAKGAFGERSPDNVQNCDTITIMDTETNEKSSDDVLVNLMPDKLILSVERCAEDENLVSDSEDDSQPKLIIDEDAHNNSITEELHLSLEGHHEEENKLPHTSEHDNCYSKMKTDTESNEKTSEDSITDDLISTLEGLHEGETLENLTKKSKEEMLQTELKKTMETLTNHQNWPTNNYIPEALSKTFKSNECQTDAIDYTMPINIYIHEALSKTFKTTECQTDSIECQTDSIDNIMPIVNSPKQQWSQEVQTDFENKDVMCQTNVSYRQSARTIAQFMASINENHGLKHIFSSNLLRLFVKSYIMYLMQLKCNDDQLNMIENIETEVDLIYIIQSNHEYYREQITKYFILTFRELFIIVNGLDINDQLKFCELLAELTAISVDNSFDKDYLPTPMHYIAYFTLTNSISRTLPVIGKTLCETKSLKLLNADAFKRPSNEECSQYEITFQNQGDAKVVSPNQQSTTSNQSTNTFNTIVQTQSSVPSTSRQSLEELSTQQMQTTEQPNTFNTTSIYNAQNQFQPTQNETFFLAPQDMAHQNLLNSMMVPNQHTTANQIPNQNANTLNIIQAHCSMPSTNQQHSLQFSTQQMQITDHTISNAQSQSQPTQNQPLFSVSQNNLTVSQQNIINGGTMMVTNQQSAINHASNPSTNTINIIRTQLLRLTDQRNTFNATTVPSVQNQMQPPQNPPTLPQQKKSRKITARRDSFADQNQNCQQNGQLKQLLNKPPQQLQPPTVMQPQQWFRPVVQQQQQSNQPQNTHQQLLPPSTPQPVWSQTQPLQQPQSNQNQAPITPRQFAIDQQSIATQNTYYQVLHGQQQNQLQPEQMPLPIPSNRVPQQEPFSAQMNQNQVPTISRRMSVCELKSSMPQQQQHHSAQLNQNHARIRSRRMSVCVPQQTTQTQVNNLSQLSMPQQQYSTQQNSNQVPIRSRRLSVCVPQQTTQSSVNNLHQSSAVDSQPIKTLWHTPQLGPIHLMGPPAAPHQRKPMHLVMGGNPATNKGPQ